MHHEVSRGAAWQVARPIALLGAEIGTCEPRRDRVFLLDTGMVSVDPDPVPFPATCWLAAGSGPRLFRLSSHDSPAKLLGGATESRVRRARKTQTREKQSV